MPSARTHANSYYGKRNNCLRRAGVVGRLDRTVFFAPMATGTERNVELLAACVQSGPLFISADDFLFKGRDVFFWHDCTSIIPNPQIVSSKTRYSDNTADFPLQRRTTKQEVKKQESERSAFCFSILARRPSARTALSISRAFPHPNGRLHM